MSQCGGWSLGEGRVRSKYLGRLRGIEHTGETTSPEHVLGDTFGIAHLCVCVELKREESGMFEERTAEAEELAGMIVGALSPFGRAAEYTTEQHL